jgi:hypothetical protein
MTKARKAPQKKSSRNQNRGLKLASALFIGLGVLVVLSMLFSSVFTQNQQAIRPVTTPVPTVIATQAP